MSVNITAAVVVLYGGLCDLGHGNSFLLDALCGKISLEAQWIVTTSRPFFMLIYALECVHLEGNTNSDPHPCKVPSWLPIFMVILFPLTESRADGRIPPTICS